MDGSLLELCLERDDIGGDWGIFMICSSRCSSVMLSFTILYRKAPLYNELDILISLVALERSKSRSSWYHAQI